MKQFYIAITMVLIIAILGGCKTDTMYARTVGEKGLTSSCVVGNMMASWVENNKETVTLKNGRMYLNFDFEHVDTQWYNRLDVTPVVMDENCMVISADKMTFVKKHAGAHKINVQFDVPYEPHSYMTYVWQLR